MSIVSTPAPTPNDLPGAPESAPEAPTATADSDTVETPTEAPAGFTQADIDRIVQERLNQERKKYADYKDLKAAAEKLKEIEDANKTEVEKAAEAAKEWEAKYAALEAEKKASEIKAAVAGVNETALSTDKLVKLLDLESAEDAAGAVAAFLKENPGLAKVPAVPTAPGLSNNGEAKIDPSQDWKAYAASKLRGVK